MSEPCIIPAIRTLNASRWTMFMARLFGRKTICRDGETWIKVTTWRGKAYMLAYGDDDE